MRFMKPMLSSVASFCMSPASTVIPARRSASAPCPLTRGLGSWTANTTRAMRASIKALAQGGVRPWWLQGSSVTYAVAPATGSLAERSAMISAWGSPARSCQPSPMMRSPLASTHPTRGLGWVVSSPRSARAKARVIASRSNSVNIRHPQAIVPGQPLSRALVAQERNTTLPIKPSGNKLLVYGDFRPVPADGASAGNKGNWSRLVSFAGLGARLASRAASSEAVRCARSR